MSSLRGLIGRTAPTAAGTWRLFRGLESAAARVAFLERLWGRRFRGRQDRIPSLGPEASILFVCYGNIMRSALAEAAMRQALGGEGPRVASAGTAARPGSPADPRAMTYGARNGLDLSAHRARRLDTGMAGSADLIFALDRLIEAQIGALDPALRNRTLLLGGVSPEREYTGIDIDDPYPLAPGPVARSFDQVMRSVTIVATLLRADVGQPA